MERQRLSEVARLYDAAPEEDIRKAELELGLVFPEDYVDLLKCSDGLEPTVNDHLYAISLFPARELVDFAEAYEVAEYLPGYLFIGFDGGGRGLFLRSGTNRSPVFLCHVGSLEESELRQIAVEISAWVDNDFDLGDPPEIEHPDRVDVYLVRQPVDGLQGLMKICKHLQLTVPVSRFREILASIPYRMCHDVPFLPYIRYATEINRTDACTGVFEVGRSDRPVVHPSWDWQNADSDD